jgi:hypothetical protein
MPTIQLGVYLTSGTETYQAVRWALEVCLPCGPAADCHGPANVGRLATAV